MQNKHGRILDARDQSSYKDDLHNLDLSVASKNLDHCRNVAMEHHLRPHTRSSSNDCLVSQTPG